jgi:hypothetical protein
MNGHAMRLLPLIHRKLVGGRARTARGIRLIAALARNGTSCSGARLCPARPDRLEVIRALRYHGLAESRRAPSKREGSAIGVGSARTCCAGEKATLRAGRAARRESSPLPSAAFAGFGASPRQGCGGVTKLPAVCAKSFAIRGTRRPHRADCAGGTARIARRGSLGHEEQARDDAMEMTRWSGARRGPWRPSAAKGARARALSPALFRKFPRGWLPCMSAP